MIVSVAEARPVFVGRLGAFVTGTRLHLPRLRLTVPVNISSSGCLQSLAEKVGSAFHPFLHGGQLLFEDRFHSAQLDEVHVFEITTVNGQPALVIAAKSTSACLEANASGGCQAKRLISDRAVKILSEYIREAEIKAIDPSKDWPIIRTLTQTSLLPFPASDIPPNLTLLLLVPANA